MVINTQAFAARGKDHLRIYDELDDFQSRRPIDVIKANHPILILDEPQKMEGKQTTESLKEFNPLFVLRYSATHKTEHNKVHWLDALDAYNQKLVKKIRVHGIAQKGLNGTNRYLYLESLVVSKKAPVARLEFEIKDPSGTIRRVLRKIGRGDNLKTLSNGLGEYARIFEEEYALQLDEELQLEDTAYQRFLKDIRPAATHNGYFSIDKKSKRLVDPEVKKKGDEAGLADDVDAYDLILRDKETLLSFPAARGNPDSPHPGLQPAHIPVFIAA